MNWLSVKAQFELWLRSDDYGDSFRKDVLSYLTRYVTEVREPFDVIALFSRISRGKRHLVLALRTLFNFYEVIGVDSDYLDSLRKALPTVRCGIDLKVPEEAKIVESLRKLPSAPLKYQALYNLLLDSGLRLVEAVELVNSFEDADAVNGFYRSELAMFRGEKQAYYGHYSECTLHLVKQVEEKLTPITASRYYRKMGYVLPKYLRKYAFDKMIELEIPESIADFIEGRVPKTIGAKHYLALARQASKYYPRYTEHIETLRNQLCSPVR